MRSTRSIVLLFATMFTFTSNVWAADYRCEAGLLNDQGSTVYDFIEITEGFHKGWFEARGKNIRFMYQELESGFIIMSIVADEGTSQERRVDITTAIPKGGIYSELYWEIDEERTATIYCREEATGQQF